jgi:hypothetical protein
VTSRTSDTADLLPGTTNAGRLLFLHMPKLRVLRPYEGEFVSATKAVDTLSHGHGAYIQTWHTTHIIVYSF